LHFRRANDEIWLVLPLVCEPNETKQQKHLKVQNAEMLINKYKDELNERQIKRWNTAILPTYTNELLKVMTEWVNTNNIDYVFLPPKTNFSGAVSKTKASPAIDALGETLLVKSSCNLCLTRGEASSAHPSQVGGTQ